MRRVVGGRSGFGPDPRNRPRARDVANIGHRNGVATAQRPLRKSVAACPNLPMVLLVQIAQRHCIGEQLVGCISAGAPHVLTKSNRHRINCSEFMDDVVSAALPIPTFSDSLQSHCAFSNERIPPLTRAGSRYCRNDARIRQSQRGCIDGYQFTAMGSRIPAVWHDPARLTRRIRKTDTGQGDIGRMDSAAVVIAMRRLRSWTMKPSCRRGRGFMRCRAVASQLGYLLGSTWALIR
jgi:hypothetical protein